MSYRRINKMNQIRYRRINKRMLRFKNRNRLYNKKYEKLRMNNSQNLNESNVF